MTVSVNIPNNNREGQSFMQGAAGQDEMVEIGELPPVTEEVWDIGDDRWYVPGDTEKPRTQALEVPQEAQWWLNVIDQVTKSNRPNAFWEKIKVNSTWNFDLLYSLLKDYHDQQVIEFLQYGWPIDRDMKHPLQLGGRNHKGGTEFEEHIDQYLVQEIGMGAMIGPFESIPFSTPVAIPPISSRPKRGVTKDELYSIVVGR